MIFFLEEGGSALKASLKPLQSLLKAPLKAARKPECHVPVEHKKNVDNPKVGEKSSISSSTAPWRGARKMTPEKPRRAIWPPTLLSPHPHTHPPFGPQTLQPATLRTTPTPGARPDPWGPRPLALPSSPSSSSSSPQGLRLRFPRPSGPRDP